jgi:iron complex outermembrane receptor protein
VSLHGDYERQITGRMNGFIQANWTWRDAVNFSMNADPHTVQAGYGIVGASIGVAALDDRWRFSLFARNLFDKHYVSVIFPTPFDTGGYSQFPNPEAYRTVGVTLDVKF